MLKKIINNNLDNFEKYILSDRNPKYEDYDINNFNILTINNNIDEYINNYLELVKPKSYIMNITLSGFDKEIKRKISVDSNVKLDSFCKCVIKIMNGDLSHQYTINFNKEYLEEEELRINDLNYLQLSEKKRFKIIYDFGDNWVFNVTVSKVINDYGDKRMYVISGKGYGVIDDYGGIYGLYEIYNKENNDWGSYDIDEFDLDEANNIIDIFI